MNIHIISKKIRTSFLGFYGILVPLTLGGVGGGLLSSCLDTVILPDDITVGEDFWKRKSDVALMVNAAYEGMTLQFSDHSTSENKYISGNVIENLIVWSARSDEFIQAEAPEGAIPNALAEVLSASSQVTNRYTNWSQFYSVINKCNIVLERAPQVLSEDPNYTEGDYLTDRSQMLVLRSLCYFYLLRNFRDIPYVDTPFMDSSQERVFKQESPAVVLQKCIESLEEAAANAIQARSYSNWRRVGWFTQDGIHALLADVYLWRASVMHDASDYQKAVNYCDLVIESKKAQHVKGRNELVEKAYPLADATNAYRELFVAQNAEESIFELQVSSNAALCKYFYKYGSNSSTVGFLKASNIFTLNSSVTNISSATEDKVFPTNDIRYFSSIFTPITGAEAFDVRKMVSNLPQTNLEQQGRGSVARTYPALDQNYIIYRLSDVMLMKAEALVQLVDTTGLSSLDATAKADRQAAIDTELQKAFELVEAVNTRSLLEANKADAITWAKLTSMKRTGKSGMELLVLEERLRELCFEGKRWYDLLRFNYRHINGVNYNESLGTQGLENLPANSSEMLDMVTRGKGTQAAGLKAKMRNEAYLYLPLPNSDVILSPELKQNPAYSSNNQYERN